MRNDRVYLLRTGGFRDAGEYRLYGEEVELREITPIPRQRGVYAILIGREIAYIGLSDGHLCGRVRSYCLAVRGGKVNAAIHEALLDCTRVRLLIATPPITSWKGLPIDRAAGLERELIAKFSPRLNSRGIAREALRPEQIERRSAIARQAHATRRRQQFKLVA